MSDVLHVEEGALPWLAAESAVPGEVIDFWNVPRSGLLHQAGHTHYFECILGDGVSDVGIWAYAPVSEDEVRRLLECTGPDELDAFTPSLFAYRWVTVAMAADDQIVESAQMDIRDEDRMGIVQRWMDREESLKAARERAGGLAATLISSD